MATKTYCDRCGKECTDNVRHVAIPPDLQKVTALCPDCLNDLQEWMKKPNDKP